MFPSLPLLLSPSSFYLPLPPTSPSSPLPSSLCLPLSAPLSFPSSLKACPPVRIQTNKRWRNVQDNDAFGLCEKFLAFACLRGFLIYSINSTEATLFLSREERKRERQKEKDLASRPYFSSDQGTQDKVEFSSPFLNFHLEKDLE